MELKNKLKNWRLEQILSQAQAAAMVGVVSGTWHLWESGKWSPSLLSMQKIESATGLKLDQYKIK